MERLIQNKHMKIGILTLYYKNYNYGGMLQAYALEKCIETMGVECEQISFDRKVSMLVNKKTQKYEYPNRIVWAVAALKKWVKDAVVQKGFGDKIEKAIPYFDVFMNQIPHSRVYDSETVKECISDYSRIIVGSDQVWNPLFAGKEYLLQFFNGKKASYAASIGDYTKINREEMGKALESFDHISVRELTDESFLKSFIRKDVNCVLDPTLLLSANEWRKVEKEPIAKIEKPYIFVYLIGAEEDNKNIVKGIRNSGYNLVCIPRHFEDTKSTNMSVYDAGPAEFLHLIDHAEYVITDSFHASVFSIIFNKGFSVLRRKTMNQRLEDLFARLSVENVWAKDEKDILSAINNGREYERVNKALEMGREISRRYLEQIIAD